jgi:xanthine dehydrogenase molybdopterin-binding subunit B
MLALSVLEALRDAVANARQPSSTATTPTAPQVVQLNAPATPERILWALHA